MKDLLKVAFGVVCGLLSAGIILLVSSQPRGQPITLEPQPTAKPVAVHITGAVSAPGMYTLPANSRVADAIEAAGGLLPEANPQAINLAAFVQDGERVIVLTLPPPPGTPASSADSNPMLSIPDSQHLVNINTASQAELETLPGIGPVTAGKIIAYREENGAFAAIEDIQNVSGIGPKTFENIRELITVDIFP